MTGEAENFGTVAGLRTTFTRFSEPDLICPAVLSPVWIAGGCEKTKKDKEGNEKKELVYLATLKHYIVYHQSNIEGVEFPKHEMPNIYQHDQIDSAEAIIKSMPKRPKLQNDNSGRAFYSPARDIVNMPEIGLFTKPQSYYSTYFHELAHSTKHESRLGKRKTAKYKASTFGDAGYAYEELIAEISATFLSADAGILNFTFENSVAYTKGWLQDYNKLVKKINNKFENN